MDNYTIKQASGTMEGGTRLMGALLMLQLLGPYPQPAVPLFDRPVVQVEQSSNTFGRFTNVFTGEYEDVASGFEESITSFYSQLLEIQEPLGKEFEQVLYDNLWDLLVHT